MTDLTNDKHTIQTQLEVSKQTILTLEAQVGTGTGAGGRATSEGGAENRAGANNLQVVALQVSSYT